MSVLITDKLSGRKDSGYIIGVENNIPVYVPGGTIQTAWRKMDNTRSVTAPANGETVINELSITFAPKYRNTKLLIEWWITYECSENVVWRARRNGTVIGRGATTDRWSGIGVYPYDTDISSTPSTDHFMWIDSPGTNDALVYDIAVGSSNTSSHTVRVNRAVGSYSANFEAGYSMMMIQEIAT